jgi:hypothetical protein
MGRHQFRHGDPLSAIGFVDNALTGSQASTRKDARIGARSGRLGKALDEHWIRHAGGERGARHAARCHFQSNGADHEAVPDRQQAVVDIGDHQVFAERAEWQIATQLPGPPVVIDPAFDIDGLFRPAMDLPVDNPVTGKAFGSDQHGMVDRLLVDPGLRRASPRGRLGRSDADCEQFHQHFSPWRFTTPLNMR